MKITKNILPFLAAPLLGLLIVSQVHAIADVARTNIPVCPGSQAPGTTRCNSLVVSDSQGHPQVSSLPAGYGPQHFLKGYNLGNGLATNAATIAIIDAYDQPNIKSDLDKYNQTYGLPSFPSCSSSVTTSCFQKIDQNGGTHYPRADAGWGLEISLDVEIAHAACQNCKILLVEASTNSLTDLFVAVDTARAMGANVISNSYGAGEFNTEANYDYHFNIPGVAVTASSGDGGYGVQYPAASKYVTAVGGTSLYLNPDKSYQSESVWSGSGSGCSNYIAKPSWQTDTLCANRTVADVSADADPNTGAAIYDSLSYHGKRGWYQVGGTSLAAPLIAATYALSGQYDSSLPYSAGSASTLHDIISGANASCGTYLCTGSAGYDGPTGLGSPNGLGAF